MRLEFHCLLHLNTLKREEGKRAELQNNFGILYRESIMTLEENGSLSTERCYCLLTGNTGMSLLLCGAGNKNTSRELSCSGYSRGELVLAFGPGLIYPRTVSDMSAVAGSKMRKGQSSGEKDKVTGRRRWGWGGGMDIGKIPEESTSHHLLKIHSDSWSSLSCLHPRWHGRRRRSEQRCAEATCRGFYSHTELGWRRQHRDLQFLRMGDLSFPTT